MKSISIHAPREGSDDLTGDRSVDFAQFLSTLPARGATLYRADLILYVKEFLSTLPARGATDLSYSDAPDVLFLSTLPARGATG